MCFIPLSYPTPLAWLELRPPAIQTAMTATAATCAHAPLPAAACPSLVALPRPELSLGAAFGCLSSTCMSPLRHPRLPSLRRCRPRDRSGRGHTRLRNRESETQDALLRKGSCVPPPTCPCGAFFPCGRRSAGRAVVLSFQPSPVTRPKCQGRCLGWRGGARGLFVLWCVPKALRRRVEFAGSLIPSQIRRRDEAATTSEGGGRRQHKTGAARAVVSTMTCISTCGLGWMDRLSWPAGGAIAKAAAAV